MPRARNLKHDFFLDDELSDHPPLARLFFSALWCLADFKGEMEWRPKKIKAQTLPYDDVDITLLAINLDKSRFIRFYSDGDKVYLNIRKFLDHQNPHKNERDKGSAIPKYSEEYRQLIDLKGLMINPDKSRMNHDENETDRADSLFLIPDSLNLNTDKRSSNELEPKQVWHDESRNKISDLYNQLIDGSGKPKFTKWSDAIIKKLRTRCADKSRDLDWWLETISKIPTQAAAMEEDWFTLQWLLHSENNLDKFCQGNYKNSFNRNKPNTVKQQDFTKKDYGQMRGEI